MKSKFNSFKCSIAFLLSVILLSTYSVLINQNHCKTAPDSITASESASNSGTGTNTHTVFIYSKIRHPWKFEV